MSGARGPYVNRHGRRPGRGLRPWLLLPKVLAAGLAWGGLASAMALWLALDWSAQPASQGSTAFVLEQLGRLFRWVVVPGLSVAIALGLALLGHHGRVMLSMRWVWAKLGLTALGVPVLHLFMSSRLDLLRQAARDGVPPGAAATQFTWGLVVSLAWVSALILIGRHKPRLGRPR